jgi:hypothetical protein
VLANSSETICAHRLGRGAKTHHSLPTHCSLHQVQKFPRWDRPLARRTFSPTSIVPGNCYCHLLPGGQALAHRLDGEQFAINVEAHGHERRRPLPDVRYCCDQPRRLPRGERLGFDAHAAHDQVRPSEFVVGRVDDLIESIVALVQLRDGLERVYGDAKKTVSPGLASQLIATSRDCPGARSAKKRTPIWISIGF